MSHSSHPVTHRARGRRLAAVGLAAAALVAACGESDDDAGQASSPPTAAETAAPTAPSTASAGRIATTPGWEEDLQPVLDSIRDLGDPALAFDLDLPWMDENAGEDVEQRVIAAVASGQLDAGYVGVRALAALGVEGFDPLVAPLVVDSYELQEAVLDSAVVDDLLPAVDALGVAGLAVLPGPMRYPLGIEHGFVEPADFAGATFHTFSADINASTAAALGATHSHLWGEERDDAIDDGTIDLTENTLTWALQNGRGSVVTLDPLWPATGIFVVNPDHLATLTGEQVTALRDAVRGGRWTAAELAGVDDSLVEELCGFGTTFVMPTAEEEGAMAEALQPVYDQLTAAGTEAALTQTIADLKAVTAAPQRQIPDDCADTDASTETTALGTDDPSALDGSFQLEWTAEELIAATGIDEGTARGNDGVYVLTFDDGRFSQFWENDPEFTCTGTYGITGDRLVLVASLDASEWECGGEDRGKTVVDAAWRIDGDQLLLSDFVRSESPDVTWWNAAYLSKPLTRVS